MGGKITMKKKLLFLVAIVLSHSLVGMEQASEIDTKSLVPVKTIVPTLSIGFAGVNPFLVKPCAEALKAAQEQFAIDSPDTVIRLDAAYRPDEETFNRGTHFCVTILHRGSEPRNSLRLSDDNSKELASLGEIFKEFDISQDQGNLCLFYVTNYEEFPEHSETLTQLQKPQTQKKGRRKKRQQ